VTGYKVADALVGRNSAPPSGRLFGWLSRNVDSKPRLTRLVIFGVAASPLPDTTVVLPLALMRYGLRRAVWPLFFGKFAHNVLIALVFYAFASWSADHVSEQASTDLALAVAVVFILLVAYSAEKARAGSSARPESAGASGLAEPPA
jgi:hypothetical protein